MVIIGLNSSQTNISLKQIRICFLISSLYSNFRFQCYPSYMYMYTDIDFTSSYWITRKITIQIVQIYYTGWKRGCIFYVFKKSDHVTDISSRNSLKLCSPANYFTCRSAFDCPGNTRAFFFTRIPSHYSDRYECFQQ